MKIVGGILLLTASILAASEHRGLVHFGETPVPGVVVVATQGDRVVHGMTLINGDGIEDPNFDFGQDAR